MGFVFLRSRRGNFWGIENDGLFIFFHTALFKIRSWFSLMIVFLTAGPVRFVVRRVRKKRRLENRIALSPELSPPLPPDRRFSRIRRSHELPVVRLETPSKTQAEALSAFGYRVDASGRLTTNRPLKPRLTRVCGFRCRLSLKLLLYFTSFRDKKRRFRKISIFVNRRQIRSYNRLSLIKV